MPGYNVVKTQRALPIGSVQPWGGNLSDIPAGWLLCNGAEIQANEYPLLSRVLRNTYGGTDFTGNFPNYEGTIRLPPTTNKALADISTGYFGDYTTDPSIPSPIDSEEALTIVEQYIGDSVPGNEPGDLSPPNTVQARTDLNLSYTPDPQGTIRTISIAGTAPPVTTAKVYRDIDGVSGSGVSGTGATFTVVINPPLEAGQSSYYEVVVRLRGQGYEVGDTITIRGNEFDDDGGTTTANDIVVTVESIGNSYFEGNITGQSIIPGFGIEPVYVVPRKLGRNHFPQHFHEDRIETLNLNDADETPGFGVTVWENPEVQAADYYDREDPCPCGYVDVQFRFPCPISGRGQLSCHTAGYWIGDSPSNTITAFNNTPFDAGVGRYALGSVAGTKPVADHRPIRTASGGHGIAKPWFTSAKNLRDKSGNTSPGDANMTSIRDNGRLLVGMLIPFSDSNSGIDSTNYDPGTGGSDDSLGPTKSLFNHAGIDFTTNTNTGGGVFDRIEEHDHEGEFNVVYDGSAMSVPEQIPAIAQPNVTPNNIPNAFQITFTTRVASLSVTNLIRAY